MNVGSQHTQQLSGRQRAATLFVVVMSSFMVPFMMAAVNVALPAIGAEFEMSAVSLGWVVTSYSLATAVVLLPFGRIGDLHGRKRVFVWGLAVFTFGAVISSLAGSGWALLAGRVVNGIGAGMNFATGMAILMTTVPLQYRGRAIGWNVTAVYLGLSVGPVLGGILAHDVGWRWIFALGGLTGLVGTALSAWKLADGERAAAHGAVFDLAGSCLYGVSLVGLLIGCSMVPRTSGVVLLVASAVGFVGFVRWEGRTESPVFDPKMFGTNRMFAYSNVAALIHYTATAGVGFLVSLYLQYAKGLSPQQAGAVLMTQPIVMTVFSPMAGRLSDRIAPGSLASVGMGLGVVSLGLFACLRQDTAMGVVVAGLVVMGFGFALFSSPNTHAVMGSVEARYYGAASGVLGTMRVAGQVLSMAVVMMVMSLNLGHAQVGPENVALFLHCQRVAFAFFGALCMFGVFASLVRGKTSRLTVEMPGGEER